jgi:hypothetical protein
MTVNFDVIWTGLQFKPHNSPWCRQQLVSSHCLASCHFSITVVATWVILLLAMILLTLFSSVNVWNVVFLPSCHDSTLLKGGSVHGLWPGYNMLLPTWNNLDEAVFHMWRFNEVTTANLRQNDHVANMVPESPPTCNQPSTLSNTDFCTSCVILAFSDF